MPNKVIKLNANLIVQLGALVQAHKEECYY